MRQHDSETTLHYVDPPYVHASRKAGNERNYGDLEMDEQAHSALSECLHDLRGMVVLSGYPSSLYDKLYSGWSKVQRSAFADGARERTECLWFNRAAERHLAQPGLFGDAA
jgi:DNA adenine methylase